MQNTSNSLAFFNVDYDWKNRKFLGRGSYGQVFKVKKNSTNQDVAIKQFNMQKFPDQTMMNALKNQIEIQIQLKSDHLAKIHQYKMGQKYTYIVLELCDQDLRNYLTTNKNISEQKIISILTQIMLGLKVMITHSFIHRDIKPANILIKDNHFKVSDFGFACKADLSYKTKLSQFCGTPVYMAPQILFQEPYTAKCDIWSVGLMLYQMIFGYPPWPNRSVENYRDNIMKQRLGFPFGKKIGVNTKDFLKKCLVVKEQERIGWQELFKHPLICNSQPGESILDVVVSPLVRSVFQKLQNQVRKQRININQIFNKYSKKEQLDFDSFCQMIKEMSPSTTSFQYRLLFDNSDKDKNGSINSKQFQELFSGIDFRDCNNIKVRHIDELVGAIYVKGLNLDQLFDNVDLNKTGSLDWKQFNQFVSTFMKGYRSDEIHELFKEFDTDSDGLISKKQFLNYLKSAMISKEDIKGLQENRGRRNIEIVKKYLTSKGLIAQQILKKYDTNKDTQLSVGEVSVLFKEIQYAISEDQIKQMFTIIDKNQSNQISISELRDMMNSKN